MGCIWHVYVCAGVAGMSSFHAAVGGTSLLILPMLFIQSFKRLSWLSMVGAVSTMVVAATMLCMVALDPLREHMPSQVRGTACNVATPPRYGHCDDRHLAVHHFSCLMAFLLPSRLSQGVA